jgi:mannose-6-phosphate isomerase-like protein (cupin superfamily)
MQILEAAGRFTSSGTESNHYEEHLRVPDLSVGTYSIPVGGIDDQTPHSEDEIYVVQRGRGKIVGPHGALDVSPGSVIFVEAGEEHRFTEITEHLALLVIFAPAEGSRAS